GDAKQTTGQMLIQQQQAISLGKKLSNVLLPLPVFSMLANSLRIAAGDHGTGLRIRLSLDPDLMNLPWEYLYRPDSEDADSISNFLMLDPTISIVREDSNPRIRITPISGKQQLMFVGTFWQDGTDRWEVTTEYNKLRSALAPV